MEINREEWQEIRSRLDTLANAVFLVGGGAVSISIGVLLGNKSIGIVSANTQFYVAASWLCLFYSITSFLLVKGLLIVQAYTRLSGFGNPSKWHKVTTRFNWFLGISGIIAFVIGMGALVWSAVQILHQNS